MFGDCNGTPDDFLPHHLREWLGADNEVEKALVTWVVIAARRLDGAPTTPESWVVAARPHSSDTTAEALEQPDGMREITT